MCGIAGILRCGEPPRAGEIERMTEALSHRGPDGHGCWTDGGVALGHRRLAIIDLAGGRQPMANEDSSVVLTYNGEVYNYVSLRARLQARGHRFRDRSDTEVVLRAYEEWGEACVSELRGMFAFGVVDRRQGRLFLARDPLGVKPLLIYRHGDCFAFASEMEAFKAIDGACLKLDAAAIDDYLRLRYIPAPRTAFKQVSKLLPGHHLSVRLDGRIGPQRRYWDLAFRADERPSPEAWVEELGVRLRQAVEAHLVADVPCGAFLSGGLDSSAIVAFMAQARGAPVKTFSIGFDEAACDETAFAAVVARRWGCDHHVEMMGRETLGVLPELVRHHGEPFGDPAAVPTWFLSRMARREVAVALSGDGGDEILAGYESYAEWMENRRTAGAAPLERWERVVAAVAARLLPERWRPRRRSSDVERWLAQGTYFETAQRSSLWRPETRPEMAGAQDAVAAAFAAAGRCLPFQRAQYADIKTYLPSDILEKVDRASMSHGLEVRVPFVDRELFEWLAHVPGDLNLRRAASGGWQGKRLLKASMAAYYPPEFVHRSKHGLAVPLGPWLFGEPSAAAGLADRLAGPGARLPELFEPERIRELVREDHSAHVWLMMVLEEWLQQNRMAGGSA